MKKNITIITIAISFVFFLGILAAIAENPKKDTEYRLQPTDVIKITVHDQPDLYTTARVSADGYISFPLLGKVHVQGLTCQKLENTLKDLLENDYLVNAQVIVFIEEYHPREISVIGEVNKPGKYLMPEEKNMTLLEAIAMAGGFTEDADINNTRVMRIQNGEKITFKIKVKEITEKGDKDQDIVLRTDDIIIVPESFF